MQLPEFVSRVLLNPLCRAVGKAQRVAAKKVFNLNEVDQILKEVGFQVKLNLLKDVIFIAWEKFSQHVLIVSQKYSEMRRFEN